MQTEIQKLFMNAASQKLCEVLNVIILACIVDLLEISEVLH
jgi:hypothetical protein